MPHFRIYLYFDDYVRLHEGSFLMESALRKAGVHHNGTIFQKSVKLLAYIDDIHIIGCTKRDVTAAFSAIERESTKMGRAVNEGKTK